MKILTDRSEEAEQTREQLVKWFPSFHLLFYSILTIFTVEISKRSLKIFQKKKSGPVHRKKVMLLCVRL